jgi:hypothetical protein
MFPIVGGICECLFDEVISLCASHLASHEN